jgi:hypothetical protein
VNLGQSILPNNNNTLIPFSCKFPTENFLATSEQIHPDSVMDLTVLGKSTGFVQCAATFADLNTKLVWIPEQFLQR